MVSPIEPESTECCCCSPLSLRAVAWLTVLAVLCWAVVSEAGQAGPSPWVGDLSQITADDWDRDKAAHLLERAGFGGTPEEVDVLAGMTPSEAVAHLVDYRALPDRLAPFDASPIWDPGMDPFPASRAEAVRIARETGEAMGVRVLAEGQSRALQPVVNKFFYGLRSNAIETQRLATWRRRSACHRVAGSTRPSPRRPPGPPGSSSRRAPPRRP